MTCLWARTSGKETFGIRVHARLRPGGSRIHSASTGDAAAEDAADCRTCAARRGGAELSLYHWRLLRPRRLHDVLRERAGDRGVDRPRRLFAFVRFVRL